MEIIYCGCGKYSKPKERIYTNMFIVMCFIIFCGTAFFAGRLYELKRTSGLLENVQALREKYEKRINEVEEVFEQVLRMKVESLEPKQGTFPCDEVTHGQVDTRHVVICLEG